MMVFGAILVSVLVALLMARALRSVCGVGLRAFLSALAGLVCLFVFAVGALIWTLSTMRPAEPFNASTYKGSVGRIAVPFKGKVTLGMTQGSEPSGSNQRPTSYIGENGMVIVPTGDYLISYYEIEGKADNQNSIILSGDSRHSLPHVTVRAGQTQQITLGPPLNASIDVKQMDADRVSMNLKMSGAGDDACTIRSSDGSAPGFQILSSKGDILAQGSFKYG